MASRVLLNLHRRARGASSVLVALARPTGGSRCTRAPCRSYTTWRAATMQPVSLGTASYSCRSRALPRYGVAMAARRLCSSNDLAVKPAAPLSHQREFSPASSLSQENALTQVQMQSLERAPNLFPYRICGHENQYVEVDLAAGEAVRAESGTMLYMESGIEMEASMGGGVGRSITRAMTGQNFMVVDFKNNGTDDAGEHVDRESDSTATVAFAPSTPSKIVPLVLSDHGGSLICQKGAFICSTTSTNIEMHFTKSLMSGAFGGEGFILQRLEGDGLVMLQANGGLVCKELEEGESLRVSGGTLVAFESSVDFDVQMMKGFGNIMFAGEGLFVTNLTGPGRVWIQSMPFSRLVDSIGSRIGGAGAGIPLGMGMGGMGGGSGGEGEGGEGAEGGGGDADNMAYAVDTSEPSESEIDGGGSGWGESDAPTQERHDSGLFGSWGERNDESADSGGGGWFSGLFDSNGDDDDGWFGDDD